MVPLYVLVFFENFTFLSKNIILSYGSVIYLRLSMQHQLQFLQKRCIFKKYASSELYFNYCQHDTSKIVTVSYRNGPSFKDTHFSTDEEAKVTG